MNFIAQLRYAGVWVRYDSSFISQACVRALRLGIYSEKRGEHVPSRKGSRRAR